MRQRSLSRSLAPKPRRRDRRASPRRHHRSSHPSRSSRPWQARRGSSPCVHLLITKLIAVAVTAHPAPISKSCHSCLATFVIGLLLDRVSSRWRWNSYYLNNLNIKGTTARTGALPLLAATRAHPSTATAGTPHLPPLGEPTPSTPRAGAGSLPRRRSLLAPEARAEPFPRWASRQSPGRRCPPKLAARPPCAGQDGAAGERGAQQHPCPAAEGLRTSAAGCSPAG